MKHVGTAECYLYGYDTPLCTMMKEFKNQYMKRRIYTDEVPMADTDTLHWLKMRGRSQRCDWEYKNYG